MKEPEEHQVTADLTIWQVYDPQVKADLSATAISTASVTYVIDPISLPLAAMDRFLEARSISKIIVTNENHVRAAAEISASAGAPIYAAAGAREAFGDTAVLDLSAGGEALPGLQIIDLQGAAGGEIALHDPREGGTIIVGDGLINFGSSGFAVLPAKYCRDAKLLRKSLRQLLDFRFERMLFAHGAPITLKAHDRLAALLNDH